MAIPALSIRRAEASRPARRRSAGRRGRDHLKSAELERARIQERIMAGLARAGAHGKRHRPNRDYSTAADAPAGLTVREAAATWVVLKSTAARRLRSRAEFLTASTGRRIGLMVFGLLGLLVFLGVISLPIGVAVLCAIWLVRERLSTTAARLLASVAFTIGPALAIWRLEWFDVWRHGMPSLSFIVTAVASYLVSFAVVGWFVGGSVVRASRRSPVA